MRQDEKSRVMIKPASGYAHTTGDQIQFPQNWQQDEKLKEQL